MKDTCLNDNRPFWKIAVSLALSLIGTILFIYFGYMFLGFFMPFVIGWFISYVASPIVKWLERRLKIVKKLGIFCRKQNLARVYGTYTESSGSV